jgi:hypothetical protein
MIISFLAPEITNINNFINRRIVNELRKANYAVWMLSDKNWLTDETVFSNLLLHLKKGINVEIVMHDYLLSEYESAKMQVFIDSGGEIFLIDNNKLPKPLKEHFCIIDYSTVVTARINGRDIIKPHRGSTLLKENQETLVENYIDNYLNIKNTYCRNRY